MNLFQSINEANKYLNIANESLSFTELIQASKDFAAILSVLSKLIEIKKDKDKREFIAFWFCSEFRNKFLQQALQKNDSNLFWEKALHDYFYNKLNTLIFSSPKKQGVLEQNPDSSYLLLNPSEDQIENTPNHLIFYSQESYQRLSSRPKAYYLRALSDSIKSFQTDPNTCINICINESFNIHKWYALHKELLNIEHVKYSFFITIDSLMNKEQFQSLNALIQSVKGFKKDLFWKCNNIFTLSFLILYSIQASIINHRFILDEMTGTSITSSLKLLEQDALIQARFSSKDPIKNSKTIIHLLEKQLHYPSKHQCLLKYEIASPQWHHLANFYLQG